MNYRHAFHAGNFADVFKHVVLCRILTYLGEKPAAFRVIDTHAGSGLYDLTGSEARRGGEWPDGIGRLMEAVEAGEVPDNALDLLKPYLDVIGALNERGKLKVYPGSPAVARAFLRRDDKLIACELEPIAASHLSRHLDHDVRIKTVAVDGWTALSAHVPPPERRGMVLVDPPYEEEADFHRLSHLLGIAHRKWATGVYALWYPIKGRAQADALATRVRKLGIPKVLRAEHLISSMKDQTRLNGSGFIVVNPPWKLESELNVLLPVLVRTLAREGEAGSMRLDWINRE